MQKIRVIAVAVAVSTCVFCVPKQASKEQLSNTAPLVPASTPEYSYVFPFNAEQAIEIVRKEKIAGPQGRDLVVCDDGLVLRVVLPTNQREIAVSKTDGKVLTDTLLNANVPPGQDRIPGFDSAPDPHSASAIAAAHFDAFSRREFNSAGDSLDNYTASVCSVDGKWRVLFVLDDVKKLKSRSEIAGLPNHNPPNYLIEKSTGRILYFNYFGDQNGNTPSSAPVNSSE